MTHILEPFPQALNIGTCIQQQEPILFCGPTHQPALATGNKKNLGDTHTHKCTQTHTLKCTHTHELHNTHTHICLGPPISLQTEALLQPFYKITAVCSVVYGHSFMYGQKEGENVHVYALRLAKRLTDELPVWILNKRCRVWLFVELLKHSVQLIKLCLSCLTECQYTLQTQT